MFEQPEDVTARIQADIARARDRAAKMGDFRAAVAAVRGKAQSQRRDIEVEVDVNGDVTVLTITPAAMDRTARDLSDEVLSLLRRARADAQRGAADATAAVLGDDDPAVGALRARVDETREAGA